MTAACVRPATEADLPFLLATEAAVFSDPWGEGGLRGQLSSPIGLSLILEAAATPVGYALSLLMPPECEILRIAISPAARRHGYGRRLLACLLSEAEAGGATVTLLDVRAGNLPAIALYESAGFVATGRRRDFYRAPREDAILMERSLPHR